MNLNHEKNKLIELIRGLNDESIIDQIRLIKENPSMQDWWSEISDEEKASIEKGIEDVKAGRVIPHEQVKKRYEKWL